MSPVLAGDLEPGKTPRRARQRVGLQLRCQPAGRRGNLTRVGEGRSCNGVRPLSYVQRARRATFISSLIRMGMRLDEIWAMILRAYTDGEIDEGEAQALAQMVMMSI